MRQHTINLGDPTPNQLTGNQLSPTAVHAISNTLAETDTNLALSPNENGKPLKITTMAGLDSEHRSSRRGVEEGNSKSNENHGYGKEKRETTTSDKGASISFQTHETNYQCLKCIQCNLFYSIK